MDTPALCGHSAAQKWTLGHAICNGNIHIGDNVFIGSNSTVLYDVHIGNNVIIGAGSLVNKDIPDGTIAVGIPCKVIGKFENYQKKLMKEER